MIKSDLYRAVAELVGRTSVDSVKFALQEFCFDQGQEMHKAGLASNAADWNRVAGQLERVENRGI